MEKYDAGKSVDTITDEILDGYLSEFDADDGILHDVYFALAKCQWIPFIGTGYKNLCRGTEKRRGVQNLQEGCILQTVAENCIHNYHRTQSRQFSV